MKGITNLSGSVGIVEFDEFCEDADVEPEAVTYMKRSAIEQALEIADAVGLYGMEVGVLDGTEHNGPSNDPIMFLRDEREESAGLAVAPGIRELDDDDANEDGDGE